MDEARIREIVREELATKRRASLAEPGQAMVAALAAYQGTEITIPELARLAGVEGCVSRRVALVAGLVLRELGWTLAYRRGAYPRERVYARQTARAA